MSDNVVEISEAPEVRVKSYSRYDRSDSRVKLSNFHLMIQVAALPSSVSGRGRMRISSSVHHAASDAPLGFSRIESELNIRVKVRFSKQKKQTEKANRKFKTKVQNQKSEIKVRL